MPNNGNLFLIIDTFYGEVLQYNIMLAVEINYKTGGG